MDLARVLLSTMLYLSKEDGAERATSRTIPFPQALPPGRAARNHADPTRMRLEARCTRDHKRVDNVSGGVRATHPYSTTDMTNVRTARMNRSKAK